MPTISGPPMEMADRNLGEAEEEREYQALTREGLQQAIDNLNAEKNLYDVAPTTSQRLGFFTVFCLIMNRIIGSGIFAQPVNVLLYAGSSGLAIVLWIIAGLIVLSITVCWLEVGMSVPFYNILHNREWLRRSAPRSGGDKNYLEYIYKQPALLATCVFGITFIVFGNLAGNAIQFGIFVEMARHPKCRGADACVNKGAVLSWAIGVLTGCALFNISTRKFAIGLNNAFAVVKILFILFLVFAGIGYGLNHDNRCRNINFQGHGAGGTFGDVVLALVYALYPYGGYEQPFYVLAEVREPKKIFPKATTLAIMAVAVFFPLTNISYLCVVPYDGTASLPANIVIAFFEKVSGNTDSGHGGDLGEDGVVQLVAVILAIFIVGSIMAQTFTASRVKQEVAKEGILPWSLKFAKGSDTLLSRLTSAPTSSYRHNAPALGDIERHREQSPIAATGLHWGTAVILVLGVGIPLRPSQAYGLLTFFKSFTIIGVLGLLSVAGLLYLKVDSWFSRGGGRRWARKTQWRPWLDPLPAIVGTFGLGFLLVAVFVPPTASKPDLEDGNLPYWVGPSVGWAAPLVGVVWWLGLRFVQWRGRWRLEVTRMPYIEVGAGGEFVQRAEVVEHEKVYRRRFGHLQG
ncbi:amino acid permease-domain-containing protein [Lasiosphaeria hispida]|uniref:Amino acid permease-domain-containing protein n=1 Tax=Lasiosphaeria hispida TaxID=260671 RepID=A0AAJ0HNT7_9PEZI|nr:amino acid permease-domain-containing protein [Lasiosphaeria hispida]